MTKKAKIRKYLDKLFELHKVYAKQKENGKRVKISDVCEGLFVGLEKLGVSRVFSETFLCYGDDFLRAQFGVGWEKMKSA